MWGNIFSGIMSVAQGDSPEEILKKQAMATVMGGTAPVGVESASTIAPHLAQTGAEQALASGVAGGLGSEMITQNPALTNSLGESSSALTQFGRDASGMATNAYDNVTDTIGNGFDYLNDKTGMENKDWTMIGLNQGMSAMQPTPEAPIQHAPMGSGISKPQVNPPQSTGLLSSNPLSSGSGEQQLTPEQMQMLRKKGLL